MFVDKKILLKIWLNPELNLGLCGSPVQSLFGECSYCRKIYILSQKVPFVANGIPVRQDHFMTYRDDFLRADRKYNFVK